MRLVLCAHQGSCGPRPLHEVPPRARLSTVTAPGLSGSLGCDLTPQGLGASPLGTGAGNSADWAASPVTEPREAVVLVLHSLTHTLGACPSRRVAHTHLGFAKFDLWVRRTPWRRVWQPTPVFLPGEFHGQIFPRRLSSGQLLPALLVTALLLQFRDPVLPF